MRYNCDKCRKYWKENEKLWASMKGLKDAKYIKLYCPACSRHKELGW